MVKKKNSYCNFKLLHVHVIKNYVIVGVLFGCCQGVVFVPEIDSGKLAPMILLCRAYNCDK